MVLIQVSFYELGLLYNLNAVYLFIHLTLLVKALRAVWILKFHSVFTKINAITWFM